MKQEKMTEREMLKLAAQVVGFDDHWVEHSVRHGEYAPQLMAALRITVEHSPEEEKRPWVCASVSTHVARVQQFLEDVPTEPERGAAMRLAILRCAASQKPAAALEAA